MKSSIVLLFFILAVSLPELSWAFSNSPTVVDVGNGFQILGAHGGHGYYNRNQNGSRVFTFFDLENFDPYSIEYDFDVSFVYFRYMDGMNSKWLCAVFDKNSGEMSEVMEESEFLQSGQAAGKTIAWKKMEIKHANQIATTFVILGMSFCTYVLPVLLAVAILVIFIWGLRSRFSGQRPA